MVNKNPKFGFFSFLFLSFTVETTYSKTRDRIDSLKPIILYDMKRVEQQKTTL